MCYSTWVSRFRVYRHVGWHVFVPIFSRSFHCVFRGILPEFYPKFPRLYPRNFALAPLAKKWLAVPGGSFFYCLFATLRAGQPKYVVFFWDDVSGTKSEVIETLTLRPGRRFDFSGRTIYFFFDLFFLEKLYLLFLKRGSRGVVLAALRLLLQAAQAIVVNSRKQYSLYRCIASLAHKPR